MTTVNIANKFSDDQIDILVNTWQSEAALWNRKDAKCGNKAISTAAAAAADDDDGDACGRRGGGRRR